MCVCLCIYMCVDNSISIGIMPFFHFQVSQFTLQLMLKIVYLIFKYILIYNIIIYNILFMYSSVEGHLDSLCISALNVIFDIKLEMNN